MLHLFVSLRMNTRQEQAKQLFESGKSKTEIAQLLEVTRQTIQRDLSNVTPNVTHPENVTHSDQNVTLDVTPKFKRYKKPGQKYLSKQNIEDMVTANEAKIKARKQRGETYNVLDTEQAFKAGRQQL